jgi:hypothetical protein
VVDPEKVLHGPSRHAQRIVGITGNGEGVNKRRWNKGAYHYAAGIFLGVLVCLTLGSFLPGNLKENVASIFIIEGATAA